MRPATVVDLTARQRAQLVQVPPVSDAELVRRLCEGDPTAQDALYRRYFGCIWSTVLRLLRVREEVEDVVHDVFVIAFTGPGALRNAESVRPWLLQVAVRQVHRRFRRRKLLRLLGLDRPADEATLEGLVSSEATAEQRTELALLDQALRHVGDSERIAWTLRYVDGYSLEEVAVACSCSLATIKRRLKGVDDRVREHTRGKEGHGG